MGTWVMPGRMRESGKPWRNAWERSRKTSSRTEVGIFRADGRRLSERLWRRRACLSPNLRAFQFRRWAWRKLRITRSARRHRHLRRGPVQEEDLGVAPFLGRTARTWGLPRLLP